MYKKPDVNRGPRADIWCAYRYAEIWQGYKGVFVVDDGRMLVLLDHLAESRFF
jgi:hypothetical protein